MSNTQLNDVQALIDAANAADPNISVVDGEEKPAALVYGERMSSTLARFRPGSSDLLQIAARAQHIERWTSPRSDYPEGRTGYLLWRKELKDFHAKRTGELMAQAGYSAEDIGRTGALIRKERLKHDEEVQALEDVVCLVFLEHYADEFIAKHEDEKVVSILAKTARKMSDEGLAAATGLNLPERLGRLMGEALGG